MKVYLSGGLKSGWQDKVIEAVPQFTYLDPRTHGLEHNANLYTLWDLIAIDQSDIIFAYLEADNPSGYGLALEVGYAKAKSKHIIFIDEKAATSERVARYVAIIGACANVVLESFEDGLKLLQSLAGIG